MKAGDGRGAGIRLEEVSFRYGPRAVLDGIDLEIGPGEMVGLLGRNGSGKSTLLGVASGVLRPRSGRVALDGTDLSRIPARERARRIAMVPQTLPIPFAFSIREWVSLGRTPYLSPLRGESATDREAVEEAIRNAQVEELADRLVGEISGGERQRAALALALAQEPGLLLLDEATAHLDIQHQMGLLALVRELNRTTGLTVLAAEHDPNLAALWFDRLLLLDGHRIVADGPPAAVLTEELLEAVFRCPVRVLPHPTEPVPMVALERTPAGTAPPLA